MSVPFCPRPACAVQAAFDASYCAACGARLHPTVFYTANEEPPAPLPGTRGRLQPEGV